MDDKLALEILKIIQAGQSFGYQTVKNDIQKMHGFIEITDTKFREVWDKLNETKCLIDFRNPEQGNVKCWRLNSERNCIDYYTAKIRAEEIKTTPVKDPIAEEKQLLEMQKLRGEVEDIFNRISDYRTTKSRIKRSEIIAIIAIVLTAIGLMLQWILHKPD